MATSRKKPARADLPDPLAPAPAQQELAPAAPAANDEARAAIVTINTQLAEFDAVEAGIADLEKTYKDVVYAVTTPKGMREACEARATINKPIFATEHARKAAKAPVLELGRNIDARAKAIDTRLRALVNPIGQQITVQEQAEERRKADLERRVSEIQHTPAQCIGKNSAQLQEVLDALGSVPLEDFAEFRERAAAAQQQATVAVTHLLTSAKLAEEAEQLRREQRETEERRQRLQARVDGLGDCLSAPYRTSERVQQAIDRITALPIGEDFAEFAPAAREKKVAVIAALVKLRDDKQAAEKAAADKVAAETMRIAVVDTPSSIHAAAVGHSMGALGLTSGEASEVAARIHAASEQLQGVAAVEQQRHAPDPDPFTAPRVIVAPFSAAAAARLADDIDRVLDADLAGAETLAALDRLPLETEFAVSTSRPADTEILALVASHYDVTWGVAASWLRTIDFGTALAQIPLEA